MKLLTQCPICSSGRLKPYAMRFDPKSPHLSRVRCLDCEVVFANPMAEQEELDAFYQNYYDQGNFQLFGYKDMHRKQFESFKQMDKKELAKKFDYTLKYKQSGRFLDVGFGLGNPLFLARLHGFEVFGTEYDADAIDFLSQYIQGDFYQGDLLNAPFEEGSFDFIRMWHVIEHLIDPHAYIDKIYRLLKPGGVLMIGTPNIDNFGYSIYRTMSFGTQRIPAIIDGMEHTIVFNKKVLASTVERAGFDIKNHFVHSHKENYLSLMREPIGTWKKFVRIMQSWVPINQTLYAVK